MMRMQFCGCMFISVYVCVMGMRRVVLVGCS